MPPVTNVKSVGPFVHPAVYAVTISQDTKTKEDKSRCSLAATTVATGNKDKCYGRPQCNKETSFEIPWRQWSRFWLRGFLMLSREVTLGQLPIRMSTRSVAPIPWSSLTRRDVSGYGQYKTCASPTTIYFLYIKTSKLYYRSY